MNNKSIKLIVILATLVLSGLLIVQFYLINQAYVLQEKQFSYDVTQSLKNVVLQILLNDEDSSQYYDAVTQVEKNLFKVSISEPLHPFYLETLLKNEFKKQEINLDFEYSIYDCFNDSVVFTQVVTEDMALKNKEEESASANIEWDDEGHYFSVYFPRKNIEVLLKLRFWFFSTLLLLIAIAFFAFTIGIILKQKKLSEVKNDFINNMTHELKTPISTIALASKVLSKEDIADNKERLKSYVQIIKNENARMQTQIEKVLQVAALEKHQLNIDQKAINCHEIILEVSKIFEVNLHELDGEIKLNLQAERQSINGDKMHFTSILINLVDNAIKYTEKTPLIDIKTYNIQNFVCIEIKDNGKGIATQNQHLIFDKFYRVPQGNVHNAKGFGIGLHYVQMMTKAHLGEISLQSTVDKGSTFTLKFPVV